MSSIVPIRRGLSVNLTDALDVSRSKSKGADITIVDNKALTVGPYLLFGSLAVIFGVAVYYGLPYSLLQLNLGMILTIFFMLLLGMLLGLVLFAVNVQSALELALLYLLFFWEKASMRAVLKKNLVAHKKKNKLTAIIYALSLGCIIFLLTSANLQINFITSFGAMADADIVAYGDGVPVSTDETMYPEARIVRAANIDPVIRNYTDDISDWAYLAERIQWANSGQKGPRYGDLARMVNRSYVTWGVSPSDMFDVSLGLEYSDPDTALGPTE